MARHSHRHHVHPQEQPQRIEERADTVVSVVFLSAAKTFDGPIAGYKTLDGTNQSPAPQPSPQPAPVHSPDPQQQIQQQQQQQQQQSSQPQPSQQQQEPQVQSSPQPSPTPEPTPSSPSPAPAQSTPSEPSSQATAAVATTKATEKPSTTDEASSRSTDATEKPTHASHTSVSDAIASSTFESGAASSAYVQPSSVDSSSSSATSAPPSATGSQSSGMSGGAKAGLAFGILLAIGALIALVVFLVRRKKQQKDAYEKTADEKAAMGAQGAGLGRSASVQTSKTGETAPRLSLRPVTQFLPDLAGKRKSGNLLGGAAAASTARGEKPPMREQANNPANPFGNHAEMAEKAPAQYAPNNPANPFGNQAEVNRQLANSGPDMNAPPIVPAPLSVRSPSPVSQSSIGPGTTVVGGVAAAGAMARHRGDAPKPLNLSPNRAASPAPSQPSPAATEFSMTSISPGAFANGPPPSNVHRVQMDFKPSMDDELGLRAGQLVRLLHEYDDGWALCIRLDRSQQGVAPRSCLSARPVKPRPPPGARGPPPRGPPPPGMYQNRPASPASGRGSPSPYDRRPHTSNGPGGPPRSMSPGPYGGGPQQRPINPHPATKRRSNSASQVRERRNSPPGPSPMNPNPGTGPLQGTQRVPMQMQAITPPGHVLPPQQQAVTSPTGSISRKPVPGQAM